MFELYDIFYIPSQLTLLDEQLCVTSLETITKSTWKFYTFSTKKTGQN